MPEDHLCPLRIRFSESANSRCGNAAIGFVEDAFHAGTKNALLMISTNEKIN
jgi:hypothetical protein